MDRLLIVLRQIWTGVTRIACARYARETLKLQHGGAQHEQPGERFEPDEIGPNLLGERKRVRIRSIFTDELRPYEWIANGRARNRAEQHDGNQGSLPDRCALQQGAFVGAAAMYRFERN
jgi:hypothetical protein